MAAFAFAYFMAGEAQRWATAKRATAPPNAEQVEASASKQSVNRTMWLDCARSRGKSTELAHEPEISCREVSLCQLAPQSNPRTQLPSWSLARVVWRRRDQRAQT